MEGLELSYDLGGRDKDWSLVCRNVLTEYHR